MEKVDMGSSVEEAVMVGIMKKVHIALLFPLCCALSNFCTMLRNVNVEKVELVQQCGKSRHRTAAYKGDMAHALKK